MSELAVRDDFPILNQRVGDVPLVYLDSAATTQKPRQVIDAIVAYYEHDNANVHRAAHALADRATRDFENAREKLRAFVNAGHAREMIFTRGTTEAINLVANALTGRIGPGDEILISVMEHHANIVPWQMLCQRTGARLVACDVTDQGDLDLESFHALLGERTALVAVGHVSNALGTVNPVAEITRAAHDAGALVLIDGAQAVLQFPVDVRALGCDFYAFSGHKMFAPTGIGVLYGREALLLELPPWQGGGEMIERVTIEESTYQGLPYRFEAGTPNIAGAVGLGAAVDYVTGLPREALLDRERRLVARALDALKQMPGVQLVGEPAERVSIISFVVEGSHPNDIGTLLDNQGIAVRTGHHCAMPLMDRLGVPGTVRAAFSLYNDESDVEALLNGVEKAQTFL
ncbi:MAG: aminotransferase class V-fold PLP-dependent enzyme [Pseudomonadota bacterium]